MTDLMDDLERDEFAELDQAAAFFDGDRAVDDAAAEKAMRALRFCDRQLARWEALAKAEKERIDRWLEEQANPLLARRQFFERCLEGYTRANHEATGAKSVKLPSGTVALRQTPPKVEVIGDPIPEVHGDMLRTTVTFDKNRVKERTRPSDHAIEGEDAPPGCEARYAVTGDGEIVPNVIYYVRVEPSFSVKPAGGAS